MNVVIKFFFPYCFGPLVKLKVAEKALKFVKLCRKNEKRKQSKQQGLTFSTYHEEQPCQFVCQRSKNLGEKFEANTFRLSLEPVRILSTR